MDYTPSQEILDKYASVLVNFALNSGKGIKKGEVVFLQVPECAKPLLIALQKAVLKAGGHIITQFLPDETERYFYELAEDHQLDHFPADYLRARIDTIDHNVAILAEVNKQALKGILPEKIMRRSKAFKPYKEWRDAKENEGKFTWTLALYGTEAAAKEAGLTIEEYWEQIIKACYLDQDDPIAAWRKAYEEMERVKDKLDSLKIEKVHVEGGGVDLWVKLGSGRTWMCGSGRNVPSFEIFISPDWRGTEGYVEFDQPLYRYGNLIKGIRLEFKEGRVVKSSASEGEDVLKEMIMQENGDKIGEFSMTDARLSKITRFMAETLFDENFGGDFGNSHIALGNAYQDSYPGDPSKISKEEWERLGYNNSIVHTDMIHTRKRKISALLPSGNEIVIYENGKFLL